MPYQILIKRSTEKDLDSLPTNIRNRIIKRLLDLENSPRPVGVKRLQGEESYRLRVGDYRILFTIDDNEQTIMIYAIGHRREVYR